jgi:hypothetical protein
MLLPDCNNKEEVPDIGFTEKSYKTKIKTLTPYCFMNTRTEKETFGEFVYQKRLECESTLRGFCRIVGLDPSNWSKVENGQAKAPRDIVTLNRIAAEL